MNEIENELNIVIAPFSVDVKTLTPELQLDLKNVRSDSIMRKRFVDTKNILDFYTNIDQSMYPHLYRTFSNVLAMFGSTYCCEKLFSTMKKAKSPHRNGDR